MKKLELKDKVDRAYYLATGDTDGWELFLEMVEAKRTQEEIARTFDVALATSHRWHREFGKSEVVQ